MPGPCGTTARDKRLDRARPPGAYPSIFFAGRTCPAGELLLVVKGFRAEFQAASDLQQATGPAVGYGPDWPSPVTA